MLGPSLKQQGGMATVENLLIHHASKDVEILHIPTHEEGSIVRKFSVFAKAIVRLLGNLLQGDWDIVHLHVSERGSVLRQAILALLAFLFRKPVVMHTHGCEFHTFYDNLFKAGKRWISAIFQRCDSVIALSESWRKYYVSVCHLAAPNVITLYNPVEIPATIPQRMNQVKVRFVFLGRIGQRKGAFDLIWAFAALPLSDRQQAEVTIAGDGEVEKAQELVTQLQLQDAIKLPGWLGKRDRETLLQTSDVFVLPSYSEGLPVALLEAMAWGLPVVTTPVGGISEVVHQQENGFLVEPGDVQQLTAAMKTLIENESLRMAMGHKARQQVLPLGIDAYWSALRSLYQSLLRGDQTPIAATSRPKIS